MRRSATIVGPWTWTVALARFRRLALLAAMALLAAACATAPPPTTPELVWPIPPEEPRIKFVRTLSHSEEFGSSGATAFIEAIFGPGMGQQLSKPYGVTADRAGRVYVTDTALGLVWVFDEKAKKVSFLGASGQGKLATPIGIAVDEARDRIFVSDAKHQRIFAYTRDDKVVLAIGQKDELANPGGLAIHPESNRLFVVNARGHGVRVYDVRDGNFLFQFGSRGNQPGEFNFPTNAFLRGDRLYITDGGNFRIQVFDLEGKFLRTFGKVGARLGEFARPKGVAVDSEDHVYVVDAAFDNFQIFDQQDRLLLFVGKKGPEPGDFWLPAGMYIDEQDRIYVADQYNYRIQVFQYLGERHKAQATQRGR